MSSRPGRGSIGGGGAPGADGNHLPELQADEPGDVLSRKLGLARVRLLEQLLAARRSTTELEILEELDRLRNGRRNHLLW